MQYCIYFLIAVELLLGLWECEIFEDNDYRHFFWVSSALYTTYQI